MRMMKQLWNAGLLLSLTVLASVAVGDTITHGTSSIDVGFVSIGNAGNAADTSGYGAVGYNYRIGQYEITASQWSTVASAAGIGASGTWSGNQPVASVSWYEVAQFCNWLTSGDKYSGAYQFDGSGVFTNVNRGAASVYGTVYVLPTEDEWYKAAFYTGSGYSLYANGTGTAPVAGTDSLYNNAASSPWAVGSGTMEQNGTYDMMGNVWEMSESAYDGTQDDPIEFHTRRGGSFGSTTDRLDSSSRQGMDPAEDSRNYVGFRVATTTAVPEPTTLPLVGFVCAVGLWIRRRWRYMF